MVRQWRRRKWQWALLPRCRLRQNRAWATNGCPGNRGRQQTTGDCGRQTLQLRRRGYRCSDTTVTIAATVAGHSQRPENRSSNSSSNSLTPPPPHRPWLRWPRAVPGCWDPNRGPVAHHRRYRSRWTWPTGCGRRHRRLPGPDSTVAGGAFKTPSPRR